MEKTHSSLFDMGRQCWGAAPWGTDLQEMATTARCQGSLASGQARAPKTSLSPAGDAVQDAPSRRPPRGRLVRARVISAPEHEGAQTRVVGSEKEPPTPDSLTRTCLPALSAPSSLSRWLDCKGWRSDAIAAPSQPSKLKTAARASRNWNHSRRSDSLRRRPPRVRSQVIGCITQGVRSQGEGISPSLDPFGR